MNRYLSLLQQLPAKLRLSMEFVKLFLTVFIPYYSEIDQQLSRDTLEQIQLVSEKHQD
jgi:hypothetical protein